MKSIVSWFNQKKLDISAAVTIALFILTAALKNIVPNTWFLGWDTVASELNLTLAFKRALNVWQEFQGVGLFGGHGYMSDLVHTAFLWLLNLVLPHNLIRYAFVFLFWFIGGLGTYWLAKRFTKKTYINSWLAALLASLIYLIHPFTIQNIYVAHDAFIWFYGLLPWTIGLFINAFNKPDKRNLFYLFISQFLFSFSGFIPQMMVAYAGILTVVTILSVIKTRKVRNAIVTFILFFMAHAYWLLPVGYFALTKSDVYLNSKLNQLTTGTNSIKSQEFGKLTSVIKGEGFYFESLDYKDDENPAQPILTNWSSHWDQKHNQVWLYLIFALALIGVVKVSNGKKYSNLVIASGFILSLTALATDTWPLSLVTDYIKNIPIVNQAFRISFTKFSSLYVLFLSLLVAKSLISLTDKRKVISLRLITLILIGWGIVTSLPLFKGELIYKRMTVDIPQDYFKLQAFAQTLPKDNRIVPLPLNSYNGWYITDWGYTGSGFLFYMIEQPILDRAFDVWSQHNETFFNQASLAFYQYFSGISEAHQINQVFSQYRVSYALLDESIIKPGKEKNELYFEKYQQALIDFGSTKVFQSGQLSLYQLPGREKENLYSPQQYSTVVADNTYSEQDLIYNNHGTYITNTSNPSTATVFPFTNFDPRSSITINREDKQFTIDAPIGVQSDYTLLIPNITDQSWPAVVTASRKNDYTEITMSVTIPGITINGQIIDKPQIISSTSVLKNNEPLDYIFLDSTHYNVEELKETPAVIGYYKTKLPQTIVVKGAKALDQENNEIFTTLAGTTEITLHAPQPSTGQPTVKSPSQITVNYPTAISNDLTKLGRQQAHNCNITNIGEAYKTKENNYIAYKAKQGGISCDFINYARYGGFDNYLIRIVGQNQEGRALKIYLHTKSGSRVDFEKLLPSGAFDQSFIVYPSESLGHVLNLETQSFGHISSKNAIESISFVPFPVSWIQNIKIVPSVSDISSNDNSLSITQLDKLSSSLYLVKTQGSGLIKLSQGYDQGWQAYKLQDTSNKLQEVFPWFKGNKLEHVKVNSWANGWLVPEGEYDVIIVFWPQYLQYLGYALLLVGGFLIIKPRQA